MKKTITTALFAVTMGIAFVLSSCSNKNDDDDLIIDRMPDPVTINPSKVFTDGMPKEVNGMVIQMDDRGVVSEMKTKDETITFKYQNIKTRVIVIPNVLMGINRTNEKLFYRIYLNRNGLARECVGGRLQEDNTTKEESWKFTYNNNDQLSSIIRSGDGYKKFDIIYKDGNITEIETTTIPPQTITRKKDTYKVFYTSDAVSTPVANKGNLMLFDSAFGIDIGVMKYVYYAGLLGKTSKDLPVQLIDKEGNRASFTWTVNSNGFPTAMTNGSHEYKFVW